MDNIDGGRARRTADTEPISAPAPTPTPTQPKQSRSQRKLSSLFSIVDKGEKDKDNAVLKSGQGTLTQVGNLADENTKTAASLNDRAQTIEQPTWDYTKAFKPPEGTPQSKLAPETTSQGLQLPKTDPTGVKDKIESNVKREGTGSFNGLTITKDMTPDQIAQAARSATEDVRKHITDYYKGAENALDLYAEDARRFLDEQASGAHLLSELPSMSASEGQALSFAELLANGGSSNLGVMELLSAYGSDLSRALDSQIYAGDVSELSSQAPQELERLSAAGSDRAVAAGKLEDTIQNKSKSLSDWFGKEKGKLDQGLEADAKTLNQVSDSTTKDLQGKEQTRQETKKNETIERELNVPRKLLQSFPGFNPNTPDQPGAGAAMVKAAGLTPNVPRTRSSTSELTKASAWFENALRKLDGQTYGKLTPEEQAGVKRYRSLLEAHLREISSVLGQRSMNESANNIEWTLG